MRNALIATIAALALVTIGAGISIGNAYSQINGLRSQVTTDQQSLSAYQRQAATMRGQVSSAVAELKSTSPFGDLISCSDLRSFQGQLVMQGTDTATGDSVSVYLPGNAWLPTHCFKP